MTPLLLPTPVGTDALGARNATSSRPEGSQHHSGTTLTDVAWQDRWGAYAPAIARWEAVLGRPAPAPVEPNPNPRSVGKMRLSPTFVEWMMGLPQGWVTDCGLSYAQALRCLGNGVVPQQAALALRLLLVEGPNATRQAPVEPLLPTPNPFHASNDEDPQEWRERRADVFARTGTRHGPALGVIAKSIAAGDPLTPDRYMPED